MGYTPWNYQQDEYTAGAPNQYPQALPYSSGYQQAGADGYYPPDQTSPAASGLNQAGDAAGMANPYIGAGLKAAGLLVQLFKKDKYKKLREKSLADLQSQANQDPVNVQSVWNFKRMGFAPQREAMVNRLAGSNLDPNRVRGAVGNWEVNNDLSTGGDIYVQNALEKFRNRRDTNQFLAGYRG